VNVVAGSFWPILPFKKAVTRFRQSTRSGWRVLGSGHWRPSKNAVGSATADRREDPPRPQLSLHGVLIDLAVLQDYDEVLAWIRNPIEVGDRIAVNPR
jgi:hypothetical protein